MPIDTSIYNNIQPVKIESPLNALAQISQLKQAQSQNRLADLVYGQKQQEIADEQARRGVLAGATDLGDASTKLLGIGQYKPALEINKSLAEQRKSTAAAQKDEFATLKDANSMIGSAAYSLAQNPSYESATATVEALKQQLGPEMSKRFGLDSIQIPQDPQQIKQWASQHYYDAISADKILADQTSRRNNDQTNATSRANNAATNATTMRGQNLTDARAREAAAQGKVPAGYRQNPDGSLSFIPGGPADPSTGGGKPPTEFQGKSAAFGARAEAADKIIGDLSGKYSPAAINSKMSVESTPLIGGALGAITNKIALSPTDQRAEQAQRDFINAVLRQESGAAISPDEFDNARKQYFPQPGDSKEVRAQKTANRKTAIQGFKNSAGRAAFSATPAPTALPNGWSVQEH